MAAIISPTKFNSNFNSAAVLLPVKASSTGKNYPPEEFASTTGKCFTGLENIPMPEFSWDTKEIRKINGNGTKETVHLGKNYSPITITLSREAGDIYTDASGTYATNYGQIKAWSEKAGKQFASVEDKYRYLALVSPAIDSASETGELECLVYLVTIVSFQDGEKNADNEQSFSFTLNIDGDPIAATATLSGDTYTIAPIS